jgi:membrane-associated phospholipid phosphatase
MSVRLRKFDGGCHENFWEAVMRRWVIAAGSASAFAALAVAVHLGLLNTFDSIVREWARPDHTWGTAQLRADIIVEGSRPVVLAGLLAAFTLAYCIERRSLRPGAFIGAVYAAPFALTVAIKWAIGRPDTHGLVASGGGSFPSGHVIQCHRLLGPSCIGSAAKGWPVDLANPPLGAAL